MYPGARSAGSAGIYLPARARGAGRPGRGRGPGQVGAKDREVHRQVTGRSMTAGYAGSRRTTARSTRKVDALRWPPIPSALAPWSAS